MYSQYIDGDSWIHKIPAVYKIYFLIIFILIGMLVRSVPPALVYLAAALIIFRISQLPVKKVLRKIRHALILVTMGAVFNFIFSPWEEALYIFLRLLAIVLMAQIVMMTTPTEEIINTLEHNFKMKSEYVVSLMIAIAFIPILESTWKEITMAQSARGYDFAESTFPEKIKGLEAILIPLFRFSIKKAEIMGEALTIKGYCSADSSNFA